MLMSTKKKFIFIHIYKTAGTSVMKVFLPYARLREKAAFAPGLAKKIIMKVNRKIGLDHNGLKHITGFHKFAKATDARDKLGAKRYAKYHSFVFVRNPYDWAVSTYFYLRHLVQHPLHQKAMSMEFDEYIEWAIAQKPDRLSDWLTDEQGNIIVDYVGRLEHLDDDLVQICGHLDIPFEKAPHENASPGREKDYRQYFNDHTRKLVGDYFADDIEMFGYDFDGIIGPGRLPQLQ